MSYTDAIATRLLATHCCSCGRPLVDATSVELGIGPECRNGRTGGITEAQREACNRLTYRASIVATQGNVEEVRRIAQEIRELGLPELADKVASRFVNAEKNAKIKITSVTLNGKPALAVDTPYKRSMGATFVNAWRIIPGRRWINGVNVVPVESKPALWALLKEFFPGDFGHGPSGVFRIPGEKPKRVKKAV